MSLEEWRPVLGHEGRYEVSSIGRVRRVLRDPSRRAGDYRMLSPKVTPGGYLQVCLSASNRGSYRYVHSLVLESFVGPRPSNCVSCHNDGTKVNNCVGNLRWATQRENMEDCRRHGTAVVGERHHRAKLTERDVRNIISSGRPGVELARHYGVSKSAISRIRNGKSWRHITEGNPEAAK